MNWADILQADCDSIIFGKNNIILYIFSFLLQFYLLDPWQ